MNVRLTVPFEFTGEYGGFIFTEEGKRRMRLCVDGNEYLLKVPKVLRRRIIANFRPSQVLHVVGTEERDEISGISKWVLSQLLPPDGEGAALRPPTAGPIRVCSKKNCWRGGGCELWDYFQRESVARGLTDTLTLKAVGCMDHCKHAPNIEWQGQTYSRCTLANAEAMIDRVEAGLRRQEAVS